MNHKFHGGINSGSSKAPPPASLANSTSITYLNIVIINIIITVIIIINIIITVIIIINIIITVIIIINIIITVIIIVININ